MLDLSATPLWVFYLASAAGLAVFVAVLFHIMPPALRRGRPAGAVVIATLIFAIGASLGSDPRGALWFGAVGFPLAAAPLLWLGPMPADMPSARDPRVTLHPKYREFRRRGLVAGWGITAVVVAVFIGTLTFVRL